ncbi:MAG: polysaccharide deacetylase family protein [bacterium]
MNSRFTVLLVLILPIWLTLSVFVLFSYKAQNILSSHVEVRTSSETAINIVYSPEYVAEEKIQELSLSTSSLSSSSSSSSISSISSKAPIDLSIKYSVPSIMYHHINPVSVNDKKDKILAGLSVSPTKFENDLKDIQNMGFETIFPYEIEEKLENNVKQDKKYVMITIDDGYEDVYKYAMPILLKYKMKATYYVMPNFVGRNNPQRVNMADNYSTWEEIKEMKDSGYINIGSHTMDHAELSNIKYTEADLRYQIFESKKVLEEKLKIQIKDFSYPYGMYNQNVANLVSQAGYLTANITKGGKDVSMGNIFRMPRYHSSNTNPFRNILK